MGSYRVLGLVDARVVHAIYDANHVERPDAFVLITLHATNGLALHTPPDQHAHTNTAIITGAHRCYIDP